MINDKDSIQDLDRAASPEQVEASQEQQGEVETSPVTSSNEQASSTDEMLVDNDEGSADEANDEALTSPASSPKSPSNSAPQSPASVHDQGVANNAPIDQDATPSQIMDFLKRAGIKTGETASRLNRSVGSRVNNNRNFLAGTVAGGILGTQTLTSSVSPLVPYAVGATLAATAMLGARGVIKLGTSAYNAVKSNPLTASIRAKIDEMRARREANNGIEAQPAAQEEQTEAQPAAQVVQPEAQPAAQVVQPEAQPAAQDEQTEVQGNTTKELLSQLADMEDEPNSTDSESTDPVIVGSKRSRPAVINSPESDIKDDSVIMELSGCSSSDSEENDGEGVEPSTKRPKNA